MVRHAPIAERFAWMVAMSTCIAAAPAAPAAASSPTIDISVTSPVVGDGLTRVELTVEVHPPELTSSGKALTCTASAGVLGALRDAGEGRYFVDFTPPRVLVRVGVDVEVIARSAGKQVRAVRRLDVEPRAEEPTFVRSSGPLGMRVPSRLQLGSGQPMLVEMRPPTRDGVRLVVNSGRVSDVTFLDDGTATATYVPPLDKVPRVLLIAALDVRGALLDWLAIPLYGQAEIATASAPFASVQVQVADVLYGPVRADARGRSSLIVSVPPDVNAATTIVRDVLGDILSSVLDLGVPPSSRMLALCDTSSASVFVLVADSMGYPDSAAAVVLSASAGVLGAPVVSAPGVVTASWTMPSSARLGELVSVEARDTHVKGASAICETTVRSGPPSRIALKLTPETFVAGSGAPIVVSAELADEADRPAVGELAADVDVGSLSPWSVVAPGVYQAQWHVPDVLHERRKAFLQVRPKGSATTRSATLVLSPGQPRRLAVTSAQHELVADGAMSTTLVAELRDDLGNAVEAHDLEAQASGHVSSFVYDHSSGTHRATYMTPRWTSESVDVVIVRSASADLQSQTTLALERPLEPLVVGARLGYLSNFGAIQTPTVAADVTWRLPFWRRLLSTGIEVGYAFTDKSERDVAGESVQSSIRLVPILARAGVEVALSSRVSVYGGAAPGLTVVDRSVMSARGGNTSATSAHLTLGGFVGAHVGMGPGCLAFELAYRYAQVDASDLVGNAGGLVGSVGYRF